MIKIFTPDIIAALVGGVTGLLTFITIYIRNDAGSTRREKRYEEKLKKAIDLGRLKNEDIYLLANRWLVKKEQIVSILYRLLDEYIDDKESNNEKLDRVRNLLEWHQLNDPFSDLPDDVRLQLQQFQTIFTDGQEEIIRLSKSLRDLYISNQQQQKRDRFLTWSGFAIGLVGIVLTLWSFIQN
ncbi:hypothetical protein C0558_08440 [Serratia marcescens]|uniref:hypothetical protein n=1 Tax=Serratia marcescens TaxID=615 RepID=UPI000CA19AD7|nr:hypothetical protein [Serratia marcescens]AUO01802.1 hypothetical protein C0558_08440 [Serratia marcescens]